MPILGSSPTRPWPKRGRAKNDGHVLAVCWSRLAFLIPTNGFACLQPHQRRPPIEFLVGVRAIPVHMVQEYLDQRLSAVGVTPVE